MKTTFDRAEIRAALGACEAQLKRDLGVSVTRDHAALAALADVCGDFPLTVAQNTAITITFWLNQAKTNG